MWRLAMLRELGLSLTIVLALFLVSACGKKSSMVIAGPTPTASVGGSALERFWVATPAGDSRPILGNKKSIKDGDDVCLAGRVKDYVGGLAVFTLIDASLRACSDPRPDGTPDPCKTPWDYCCVDETEKTDGSVNVEFRDGADPIAADLPGFHGFDRLKHVVVVGKAAVDATGSVTIIAKGIHIKP